MSSLDIRRETLQILVETSRPFAKTEPGQSGKRGIDLRFSGGFVISDLDFKLYLNL